MHETLTLHSLTQVGPTVNGGSVEEPVKFGHYWRPTGAEIDTGVRPVNTPGLIVWIEDVEETIVPLDDHGKREPEALGPNVIGGADRPGPILSPSRGTLLGALLAARDSKRRSVGRVAAFVHDRLMLVAAYGVGSVRSGQQHPASQGAGSPGRHPPQPAVGSRP